MQYNCDKKAWTVKKKKNTFEISRRYKVSYIATEINQVNKMYRNVYLRKSLGEYLVKLKYIWLNLC